MTSCCLFIYFVCLYLCVVMGVRVCVSLCVLSGCMRTSVWSVVVVVLVLCGECRKVGKGWEVG